MIQTIPLRENGQVVINASGYGKVSLGPSSYGVVWKVEKCSVRVTSISGTTVSEPVFSLYYGGIGAANFISGSYTGSRDDDPSVSLEVPTGQVLWAEWTGADVGATATVILYGTIVIG